MGERKDRKRAIEPLDLKVLVDNTTISIWSVHSRRANFMCEDSAAQKGQPEARHTGLGWGWE